VTGYLAAANAIEAKFAAGWKDGSGAQLTAVAQDNEDFTPPSNAPWVRLVVRSGTEGQKSFGPVGAANALFRNVVAIIVQIFTPPGTGREEMWALAETAAAIFRGQQIATASPDTSVTCRAVSIVYVGIDKDTGFFQMNATVDAFTDTLR